jgi:transketolase
VLGALADQRSRPPILRLAARDTRVSGHPAELLHAAGIDAAGIVRAVRMHLDTSADAATG